MSKLGDKLLAGLQEALTIACGNADPSSYRFAVPVVSAKRSPLNPTRWCCTLQCGHDAWVTSKRKPKVKLLDCQRCKEVPRPVVAPRAKTAGSWTKETRPNSVRPAGALNRITRTMKDAAVEAAHELGQAPVKQWGKQLNGDLNGLKGYFKFLAVRHPKSFAIILSKIMPVHISTSGGKLPKFLTEEQMRAELRANGLPEDLIKFMHPVDVMSVDPDEVGEDPYPDPEADDEPDMLDVTPKE
jgi:hypothetical protein